MVHENSIMCPCDNEVPVLIALVLQHVLQCELVL